MKRLIVAFFKEGVGKVMFKIGNYDFGIKQAKVYGVLDKDEIAWGLNIDGEGRDFPGVSVIEPRAYSFPMPFSGDQPKTWREFAGRSFHWDDPYNSITERSNGCLYAMEHEDIYDSTLEFGAINSGKIEFKWNGLCDVFFDDSLGDGTQIEISGMADLGQIMTNTGDENEAKERLNRFLTPTDFELQRFESEIIFVPVVSG